MSASYCVSFSVRLFFVRKASSFVSNSCNFFRSSRSACSCVMPFGYSFASQREP